MLLYERKSTGGRVVAAGCVAKERLKTDGRVVAAACEVEERIVTLSGVSVGIASVRWWGNRWNAGAKATARNHNRNFDHKTGAAQSGAEIQVIRVVDS